MSIIKEFLKSSESIWEQYYTHPFVKGIGDGSLDREKFKHYILQDYLYLIDYAKVFSIGSAKAEDLETMQFFSGYANQIFAYETDIHKGYIKSFEISREEIERVKMSLDNLSYVSYMLRVAYEHGVAEILAAVLSCAISYEFIAKKIVEENPQSVNHHFYGEWIKGYASDEYCRGNEKMTEMIEKLTKDCSQEQRKRLVDIFVACSRYELEFWNMAWNLKG